MTTGTGALLRGLLLKVLERGVVRGELPELWLPEEELWLEPWLPPEL